MLPLKRTNLIPASLQEREKEKERERDRERERERERENQKVFPSLRDPDASPRLIAGGGGGKAGMRTESCTSLRKGRYCSTHHSPSLSTFILSSSSRPHATIASPTHSVCMSRTLLFRSCPHFLISDPFIPLLFSFLIFLFLLLSLYFSFFVLLFFFFFSPYFSSTASNLTG